MLQALSLLTPMGIERFICIAISEITLHLLLAVSYLNPRTAGGLSHLRTAGGGADDRPPPPRELEN